jgi:photosystem II stability/assembly factor-like uncharacterized protein
VRRAASVAVGLLVAVCLLVAAVRTPSAAPADTQSYPFPRQNRSRLPIVPRGAELIGPSPALWRWTLQRSGTERVLFEVAAADEATAWAVGLDGTILATTDRGAIWTAQRSGTAAGLYGVAASSPTVAWAVDHGATSGGIAATTDGGATWTTSAQSVPMNAVAAASPSVAWAVGESGVIVSTTDGGVNWFRQQSSSVASLHGVAVGGPGAVWVVGSGGVILRGVPGADQPPDAAPSRRPGPLSSRAAGP